MEKLDYTDKRCLIIEDRRPFLMLLKGLLGSLGAKHIVTHLSAEAAIKDCRNNEFDIIVCDLNLGTNHKNGFEFLEEVRKLKLIKPSTVVIMISGDSARSMVLGSLEKQPDDFLIKPFSQAQLNARIARATNRRIELAALYSQVDHKKYKLSIETCQHFLETGTKYTKHCVQLLVQLYWKTKDYKKAEALLNDILQERPIQWAVTSMARTQLLKKNYSKAIELGKQAIQASHNNVEAYDIIADACLQNNMKPEALNYIRDALNLSPLSIERHYRVCEIARANQDYGTAMRSARAIWELSQRSVHKNVNHMCSYIRSILDAAEHSEDKTEQNKLKQEALLALQRSQNRDTSMRHQEGFDFEIFEKIIHARILYLDGKKSESKRLLEESQIAIEENFSSYPLAMAPDSLKAMFDLGDYEEASKVTKVIKDSAERIDANIQYLMESEAANAKTKRAKYVKHNKKGIELYSTGNFQEAYEEFSLAKKISPLNIGVTLNLMQCLIKLMEAREKPEAEHVVECRDYYRFVSNMPLKASHKKKFELLRDTAESFIHV